MSATRFQIYLNPHQYDELKKIARKSDASIAAVIRDAIDDYLRKTKKSTPIHDDPLWDIVGSINRNSVP